MRLRNRDGERESCDEHGPQKVEIFLLPKTGAKYFCMRGGTSGFRRRRNAFWRLSSMRPLSWPNASSFDSWAQRLAKLSTRSLTSGSRRVHSIKLAARALLEGVEGDFVELGAYNGGMSVLLLKVLLELDGSGRRKLWAADSFAGLRLLYHAGLGWHLHLLQDLQGPGEE